MWNVIGQDRAVKFLRHSLETGRLAHAYLFVGPPHVGKMTLATVLAQAVNCEQEDAPCGECRSCVRIEAGKHADVRTIERLPDGNSGIRKEIGIGQVRELQQAAGLLPYEGRHRVFIIDGAEHLNEESSNSLLKVLEEPPSGVLLILLAGSEIALLPTIVSRCQRVELVSVPAPIIEQALIERWQVESVKARVLSRLCRGSIGWAISASANEEVLRERALALAELEEVAMGGLDRRFEFAAKLALRFGKSRDSVEEVLRLWLGWWRDMLLVKVGCEGAIINVDREESLSRQAECCSLLEVRGTIEAIGTALVQLQQNANPRLALEVLMLSIPVVEQERAKRPSGA